MKPKLMALLIPACLALWAGSAAAAQRFAPADGAQHFLLNAEGGVIQAEAGNPEDPMAPDEIRANLTQVAKTGVPELQRLRADINYVFTPTAGGGELRIESRNAEALNAIHEYLRTEIRELQTGDSENVK